MVAPVRAVPGEKAYCGGGHDVLGRREGLVIECKCSVRMTHNDCDIEEDEVLTCLTRAPTQLGDSIPDLGGTYHVLIRNRP